MPWEHCGRQITDEHSTCPTCGAKKERWTLQFKKTRRFSMARAWKGDTANQVRILEQAARHGIPFCERCAKAAEAEGSASE